MTDLAYQNKTPLVICTASGQHHARAFSRCLYIFLTFFWLCRCLYRPQNSCVCPCTTRTYVPSHAPLCHHMHLCVTTCTSVYRLHTHALGTSFVQDLPVLPSVADLVHMHGSDRMINSSVTLQLGLRLCCQYYICYVFRPWIVLTLVISVEETSLKCDMIVNSRGGEKFNLMAIA